MVTHFIFLSSSYERGTRIALNYIVTDSSMQEKLQSILEKITEKCGKDVSISTHMIQTEDETWESVCKSDHFFKDVKVIDSVGAFIRLINKDRELKGIDIAKYILSKVTCTHLKLEKLVYLCFADYLCETGKNLFTDKIYAFKYGPVVDSVYEEYKKYGYKAIDDEILKVEFQEMPTKSRILFAKDSTDRIMSVDKTLRQYGELTANELVDLTHREKTPWSKTYKKFIPYLIIRNETIKEYHKNEVI